MNPDAVTTNHSAPHFTQAESRRDEHAHSTGDDSLFKEPISADVPRRAIDRKILESLVWGVVADGKRDSNWH